ncbi:MAG: helix-turn-helix domain-containing protein [Ruthenibacterium lactatiformans]
MLESIRELRRRKNFTLRQLSEKTGYTVSFLSQLERGIKNPSLDALRAIAQALDVSLVSLMNNSDYTAGSRGETGDDAGESGFCVLPPDGRRTMPIDLPGVRYQLLNAQQLAPGHAGDVTMVLCTLQPGCSSSGKMVSHLTPRYALSSRGASARCARAARALGPGDTIRVTPGVLHDFYNVGDAPAVVLAVTF